MTETAIASYEAFIARIVDEGIAAARADYPEGDDKLRGSVAGFEACRSRTPEQLGALLSEAHHDTLVAHRSDANDYWYWRCRELEIEWVCNVVSAALMNVGQPVIVPPTARGAMKAADILGVAPKDSAGEPATEEE